MSSHKREAVLRAAIALFSRQGVRRTSMSLLAEEAGVAKPTLYAYFESKDAVYAAVCQVVGEQILAEARAAAAATDRDLVSRVAAVLSAKFTRVYQLVDSSPYAQELLSPDHAEARRSIDAADAAFRQILRKLLDAAVGAGELDLGRLGLTVPALVGQLMQLGHGAGYGATSVEEQRASLTALVAAHLRAGLRPARRKR
jgi:AcrR family transcriptional regulator